MTTTPTPQQLPDPQLPWFDPKTGKPTIELARWAQAIDQAVKTLGTKV